MKATFDDLLALVRRLLGEGGCEWDRAQTPRSLLPYLIEEAYELREAVLSGEEARVTEELGDLALHVAFQSVLAEERGAFDGEEVLGAIIQKMVRRHPHLFGELADDSAGPAAAAGGSRGGAASTPAAVAPPPWEELKRKDRSRAGGGTLRLLEGLPLALPALLKAQRMQERAAGVGFDWPDAAGALQKVHEELEELASQLETAPAGSAPPEESGSARPEDSRSARPEEPASAPPGEPGSNALEEEVGDLLFAVVNVARWSGISAEAALEAASAKFKRRFESVERLAVERGMDVASAGLEKLDALWDEVKLTESSPESAPARLP